MAGLTPVGPSNGPQSSGFNKTSGAKRDLLASAQGIAETDNSGRNAAAVESEATRLSSRLPRPDGVGSNVDVRG